MAEWRRFLAGSAHLISSTAKTGGKRLVRSLASRIVDALGDKVDLEQRIPHRPDRSGMDDDPRRTMTITPPPDEGDERAGQGENVSGKAVGADALADAAGSEVQEEVGSDGTRDGHVEDTMPEGGKASPATGTPSPSSTRVRGDAKEDGHDDHVNDREAQSSSTAGSTSAGDGDGPRFALFERVRVEADGNTFDVAEIYACREADSLEYDVLAWPPDKPPLVLKSLSVKHIHHYSSSSSSLS